MRNLLFLSCFVLFISACCRKTDCAIPGMNVLLHNYSASDLDTIYVTGYTIGTNFTDKQVDTVQQALYPYANDSVQPLYVSMIYQGSHDVEVYIPATQDRLRFSDYTFRSYSCDDCFMRKKQINTAMDGLKINGTYYKETAHFYK